MEEVELEAASEPYKLATGRNRQTKGAEGWRCWLTDSDFTEELNEEKRAFDKVCIITALSFFSF